MDGSKSGQSQVVTLSAADDGAPPGWSAYRKKLGLSPYLAPKQSVNAADVICGGTVNDDEDDDDAPPGWTAHRKRLKTASGMAHSLPSPLPPVTPPPREEQEERELAHELSQRKIRTRYAQWVQGLDAQSEEQKSFFELIDAHPKRMALKVLLQAELRQLCHRFLNTLSAERLLRFISSSFLPGLDAGELSSEYGLFSDLNALEKVHWVAHHQAAEFSRAELVEFLLAVPFPADWIAPALPEGLLQQQQQQPQQPQQPQQQLEYQQQVRPQRRQHHHHLQLQQQQQQRGLAHPAANLTSLPDDIFCMVLSFLPFSFKLASASAVCRSWFQTVLSRKGLADVGTLTVHGLPPFHHVQLPILLRRLFNLRRVDLGGVVLGQFQFGRRGAGGSSSNNNNDNNSNSNSNSSSSSSSSDYNSSRRGRRRRRVGIGGGSGAVVTDSTLESLAQCCPALTSLDLSHCDHVTSSGLRSLARGCHGLKSLNLSNCTEVTDQGLQSICLGCPQLRKLTLRGCYQLSSAGVEVMRLARLTKLDLGRCNSIDDTGLCSVAIGCPKLRDLRLYYVQRITKRGIAAVVRNNKCLTSLDISGCRSVTDEGLLYLLQCPKLVAVQALFCPQLGSQALSVLRSAMHVVTST